MPAGICLPPKVTEAFRNALVAGKIVPEKLVNMTSEERHALFSGIVGEGNAKFVNGQFEAKILLKDQQAGYLRWAKKLTGVSPEIKRDLITRIGKLEHVLVPTEEKAFLKDLASTKLGMDVTAQEAKQLSTMSRNLQELQVKQRSDGTFPTETDRMNYGYAKVDMGNYLADLKNQAGKPTILEATKHPFQVTSKVAGLAKSLKATLDDSALLRQGWKTLLTNPVLWQRNARQSFIDIARQLGNKNVMREVNAEIASRPNFNTYEKMGLAIGKPEEEFPTALPGKVPILGRVYKASESAYTGFLYRQRADIADKYLEIAQKSGVDITDKAQLQAIGNMVNALTGRGNLGRLEGTAANSINNVFFSGRFIKSNFDTLTAHQFQKHVTPFVRKQAAVNLVKVISGTAAILAIANAVKPGSVELDPRSSNFGKIKVGDTTFDVSGGMAAMVTLAAQILKQSTKSSTTGVVSKLNSGYGSKTGVDVVNNFFENKLSPAASLVKDLIKQQDFNGNKPTVKGEASNLLTPLPFTTVQQSRNDPHAANTLLTELADALGVSANTNQPGRTLTSLSKTQVAFKQAVGNTAFQQANNRYNTLLNNWMAQNKARLNSLPAGEQAPALTAVKQKIQSEVYKTYGFKPPKTAKHNSASSRKKGLLSTVH